MTDVQYQGLIAQMYSDDVHVQAIGMLVAPCMVWLQVSCVLLVVVIFFLALRRSF